MNLTKIKKELQQMKKLISQSSNTCSCRYVEIIEDEVLSSGKITIIEANQKCFEQKGMEQNHVGFTQIIISSVNSNLSDFQ
ncbi:MAG TPA: hypothetical protein VF556_14385 [Pyrinomonadaceae bacterium]|jgi:predicted kinase